MPAASAEHPDLPLVLCRAGRWPVAIEARRVLAARSATAGDEGQPSLCALLGLDATEHSRGPRQILSLDVDGQARRLLVGGPVELLAVPAGELFPLPPLLAARCQLPGLRALRRQGDTFALVIVPEALQFPG